MKIILSSLLIAGLVAAFVFVAINPYLYHQPLKGILRMVKHRMLVAQGQQKAFGGALTSLNQKFSFVILRTLWTSNFVILGNFFKIPVDFFLFLLGLVMLLYSEVKYIFKNYRPSLRSIIFVWVVVTFIGTIAWIPLDWDRYYLPVVPCVAMMVGYGIDKIISKIISR